MNLKETADALSAFHMALLQIDENRAAFQSPDLASSDLTWRQRIDSVLNAVDMAWVDREPGEPPAPRAIAQIGAHVVAMYVAAARAEQLRIESRDPEEAE